MEIQENIEKNIAIKKFKVLQNEKEQNEMFISKKISSPERKVSQVKFITKKNCYFKVEDLNASKKKSLDNIITNEGRWSKEEHNKFLEGIVLYGINWKKVKTMIGSRTSIQVRSHAQKFYYKMKTCKDEKLGIDFTSDSICNIRDMIKQIKNNNSNYNIINVFKYLTYKCDNLEKSRKKNALNKNKTIDLKKNEINNQSNIISLKENNYNIDGNNCFFNQNKNNINEQKKIKEKQNFNDNGSSNVLKINNQNNIINILQNLLTMNYYSNLYNFILSNNYNTSNYDITNNVNKLLNNYLLSNNSFNNSNIFNEKVLLSLALQNKILNNINNINFINNINNDNNLNINNINSSNNINGINNYNNFNNMNNENSNDKVSHDIFIYIDNKEDNKDDKKNKDNKDNDIAQNKKDLFYSPDKELNEINDKEKNNTKKEDNSNNKIDISS